MISIGNWTTKAVEKLEGERKTVSGQKEAVMADAVLTAIKDFCLQDEEFAQAIVQGGAFADCMKAVAKGVGSSISDLDAYKKAVQFYFPGAKVKMQLTIDLIGDAASDNVADTSPNGGGLVLDLADFFG